MNNEMRFAARTLCRVYPLLLLIAVAMVSLLVGCSSEDPNLVGIDLVDAEFDSLLQTVEMLVPARYGHLTVTNSETPIHKQEVVYFGEQGQENSAILANYDFSDLEDTLLTDTNVTAANIHSVFFRLYVLQHYEGLVNADSVIVKKSFVAHQLTAPFDTLDYESSVPQDLPAYNSSVLNTNSAPDHISTELQLEVSPTTFVNWYDQNEKIGVIFKEGGYADIDSCLIGLASREMVHASSSIDTLAAGTLMGAILVVQFNDNQVARIQPVEDTSTLQLDTPPTSAADGMLLRTLDRRFPVIDFNLSLLPDNVLINRAVLAVTIDNARSYGTLGSLVVSEVDTSLAEATEPLDVVDLPDNVYEITGASSVDPTLEDHAYREFVVTNSIQRYINQVYNSDPDVMVQRSFLLSAGESFFGDNSEGVLGPDFYLRTFRMFGSGEADTTLWPKLIITYTRDNEITGGGK